ncbi:MAG: minor capsid protein [Alphaproteobacteria bacterium]|nr:minor capsid protein [Alphaproteobacteria bacterium]
MPEVADLPFKEAIDFYRRKVNLPTKSYTDLWEGMHGPAFVVAGAQQATLLSDLREAVDRAISEGTTIEDFRKAFDKTVARHGWDYKGGRNWRSRVIFDTNLRQAYNAGKWEQANAAKKQRPYLRYIAVLDSETRPEHRAWHNTVLPIDHEWWRTHHPSCGWRCRCTTQSLASRDLKSLQLTVSEDPKVEWVSQEVKTPQGAVTVRTPKGIDPGFGYNPGIAGFGHGADLTSLRNAPRFEPIMPLDGGDAVNLPELPVDKPKAKLAGYARGNEAKMRATLRQALGGEEKTFTDPIGAKVVINQALADHIAEDRKRLLDGRERFFPLLGEAIEAPAEIWVTWARDNTTGRVLLRRRYAKRFELEKDQALILVCDCDNGRWSGFTTFAGAKARTLAGVRQGRLLYRR